MHLNKISHKISKPAIRNHVHLNQPPPPPPEVVQSQHQQQQHQPPVYNINKSDFREVVQKLTGSPAHERLSAPQPIQQPKPASSRLHRIRPPPLAQLSNRPPPLLNNAASLNPSSISSAVQPLSPLPPFPTVHAAAESPISAYMRYLQNSTTNIDSDSKRSSGFSPLAPRWNNFAEPRPLQNDLQSMPAPPQFPTVSSPGPFGCMQSPKSPYPLLSPSLLGSPTLSVPNPICKGAIN